MKLTVIGGGGVRSLMLAKSLAQNAKEYNITHIVFMDNNVQKLNIFGALAREVAIRIMPSLDFTLTTNPVEAIQSADYIITTIRAGEDDMRIRDERIALAHNVLGRKRQVPPVFPLPCEVFQLLQNIANWYASTPTQMQKCSTLPTPPVWSRRHCGIWAMTLPSASVMLQPGC